LIPKIEQAIAKTVITAINNLRSEGAPPIIDPVIEDRRNDVIERQKILEFERINCHWKSASQSSRQG